MAESDTVAKINKYRNLKLAQAGVVFAVFLLFVFLFFNGLSDDIEVIILTPVLLICTLIALTAALLLHFGNVKGSVGALKAFLFFGCISYSFFDKCGGGFMVVRERIIEIEQGTADAKENV